MAFPGANYSNFMPTEARAFPGSPGGPAQADFQPSAPEVEANPSGGLSILFAGGVSGMFSLLNN
jgi:hypothetical protein